MNALPHDWNEVKALFEACLDAPAEERARLLGAASDPVREEVEALLTTDAFASPLEGNAADWAAPLFAADAEGQLAIPKSVGPWRLLRRIGLGGMGVVHLAERADGLYQHKVAIKFLRMALATPRMAERFDRERQLLARLRHAQIAELLDGGITAEGTPYLVMAYIEGEPLRDYVRRVQPDLRARLRLLRELARPVAHAHRHFIVHRDIKPANVLVATDGTPVLLDFGIAKALEGEGFEQASQTELALTPAFAAPEQRSGDDITAATDVYQLGLIALELLGGSPVEKLRDATQRLTTTQPSHVAGSDDAATDPRLLRGEIDWVVARALDEEPQRRYRDAESFGEDLQALLDGHPVQARPTGKMYRLRKWVGRNRLAAAMLALAIVSILGGALGAGIMAVRAQREAATALAVQRFLQSIFFSAVPDRNGGTQTTALDIANNVFDRLEHELTDEPLARANLYGSLASMYNNAGDSARQLESSERALALLERTMPDSPALLDARMRRIYGLVYVDRMEEARSQIEWYCTQALRTDVQRAQCAINRYGMARSFGDPEHALQLLRDNQGLLGALRGPLWHAARHARVMRRYALAGQFVGLFARKPQDPVLRSEAAMMLSALLPSLEVAGAHEFVQAQWPRIAAEQRLIWGVNGNHASDFAVDRLRMFQLAGKPREALQAAREIAMPDKARLIDVEPLLARGWAELDDGDAATARQFLETVRATLEGRSSESDPRLWLARAGLACLGEKDGDASATAREESLLKNVPAPDFDEYASLARAPCSLLAASPAGRRPLPEPAPDAATLFSMLERQVLPNIGRCPDGTVVDAGATCPQRERPSNLR